jgi:hypothetical protein
MTPGAIRRQAKADGVSLTLSPAGTIRVAGNAQRVNRWLPAIRANKLGLLAEFARNPELFDFVPRADPDSDREAIEERAAIIAEGCGTGPIQARQEAFWHAHREQAWRRFLLQHARIVLEAPPGRLESLLDQYEKAAAAAFGRATGLHMARTMRRCVVARATA